MSEEYIYVLKDPRSMEVRYVGKTSYPTDRFYCHLGANSGNKKKDAWTLELRALGQEPLMEVIEYVDFQIPSKEGQETPGERERYWIKHFREAGSNLLNRTPNKRKRDNIIFAPQPTPMDALKQENEQLRCEVERLQELLRNIAKLANIKINNLNKAPKAKNKQETN